MNEIQKTPAMQSRSKSGVKGNGGGLACFIEMRSINKKEALSKKDSQNSVIEDVKTWWFSFRHSTIIPAEALAPTSPVRRSVIDSPQLTFQPIDVDLMGDLHDVIFRSCSLCNNSKNSISDPQLIDLSLEDKVPCGPSCVASPLKRSMNIPQTSSDQTPPPLLPRPPSSLNKLTPKSSSTLSETSNTPPKLLIQLDNESCSSSFSEISQNASLESFSSYLDPEQEKLSFNPFHFGPSYSSFESQELSICKSFSGPNVKNMVDMWQSPSSQYLSSSSDGLKTNVSAYKAQILSRTLSTPPSSGSTVYGEPASMVLLKSASKVSTNPFVVADSKNNNCKKDGVSAVGANLSAWENFQ
ncbi:uncharacterized protein TNCV_3838611 [Trichonephila clavipes]|nr:uncharacterized protein TNCV_3838611 [Trichonephila clavipes]